MKVCGPKYALFGVIISTWGVIQLAFMGLFFYFRSVALVDDLPLEGKTFKDSSRFFMEVNNGFQQNALNCWIAAILYVVTLVFSGYQFYLNSRSSLSV